ncbi:MAG: hypothetical protein LBI72_01015 [Flavobacteriaceae bacterium]|jgi:hypothetical protein|nr:hypothetical protein [Flavobacteriaceae bacterium]
MNIGDYIIKFMDRILDIFNTIKGYLEDALGFFEKLKSLILEVVEYFSDQLDLDIDELDEEDAALLEEEHFFI